MTASGAAAFTIEGLAHNPKCATSGLRGLVTDLNETVVRQYTRAFITAYDTGRALFVGRDLRASSPQIANWIIEETLCSGLNVCDCGAQRPLPRPSLCKANRRSW